MDLLTLQERGKTCQNAEDVLRTEREKRDAAVLEAVAAKIPYRQIAEAAGITYGRVGQIVTEAKQSPACKTCGNRGWRTSHTQGHGTIVDCAYCGTVRDILAA